MLSRLNWDLQIYLLRPNRSWNYLDRSIDNIAFAARDIVESTLTKDLIEGALRSEWQGFLEKAVEAAEQGSPHVFDLFDANLTLLSRKYETFNFRDFHDGLCARLVTPAIDLVSRLVAGLEGEIGEFEIRALHLGKLVDHGIHPQDVYRLTSQFPADFDSPSVDYESPTKGSWWLATRDPIPGEIYPSQWWFHQVQKRWEELSIPRSLPTEFLRSGDEDVGGDTVEALIGLVDEVGRDARDGLATLYRPDDPNIPQQPSGELERSTPEADATRPGYLGLKIDMDRRLVGRQGRTDKIDLTKRQLLWGLILKLEKSKDYHCPMEIISQVWKDHGRAMKPSPGTVFDALHELEALLEPALGVTIQNARKLGWRLADMGNESAE